jgi:hypothetical protein
MLGTPVLDREGERIEREALLKIHHGHDRPAIVLQYLAAPAAKMPTDQADGSDQCDTANQDLSSAPSLSTPIRLWHRPRSSPGETFMQEYPLGFIRIRTRRTRRRWKARHVGLSGSPALRLCGRAHPP